MRVERDDEPVILVVEDQPEELGRGLALRFADDAEVVVRHPSDIEAEDIAQAQLVLMDYRLDHWPERDGQPAAFDVRTGMALATILREAADEKKPDQLTAVALHTGHLSEASGRLRPPYSTHVVARLNNLEWVFEKTDEKRFDQILLLARAAQRLDGCWPTDPESSEVRARRFLHLDSEVSWFGRSWREVRECQPPIYELAGSMDGRPVAGGAHGLFFLRWLLHQVLPYPCFLWDVNWVAARLRIGVRDLERLMASNCDLARDLDRLKYRGILAGFLGPRWWRAAIEDYAWEIGYQESGTPTNFEERLRAKAGEDLQVAVPVDAVVCLNRKFLPEEVASPQDAVRLRPDYWPAFADAAWMRVATVRDDPELKAMVEPLDQYRVESDE